MLNIYGPYEGKIPLWKNIFYFKTLLDDNIILVGELEFTLKWSEILGLIAHPYILAYYFNTSMESASLVDVSPIELRPS